MLFIFSTLELIRNLWQLKTVVSAALMSNTRRSIEDVLVTATFKKKLKLEIIVKTRVTYLKSGLNLPSYLS